VRKIIPKDQPFNFHNVEDPASLAKFLDELKN
jgi:hypothetical protein